jgi:O-antigen ligase
MPKTSKFVDYEPVSRPGPTKKEVSPIWADLPTQSERQPSGLETRFLDPPASTLVAAGDGEDRSAVGATLIIGRGGHALSFVGLFAFTFLVYFRPYELSPSLAWLSKSAFWVAAATLFVFVVTQLSLENRITAKIREVKLVAFLTVAGLLSVPLALDPGRAITAWVEYLKVLMIFVVIVNVIRTQKRLNLFIGLVLLAGCVLAVAAVHDYLVGNLGPKGDRIEGVVNGLFSNPNDLALHLVTMVPLAIGMLLASRNVLWKLLYSIGALLLTAGIVVTFSRGGFLGLLCVIGVLSWNLVRGNKVAFGILAFAVILTVIAFAPTAYRNRLATTRDDSALARTDDLKRSIYLAVRHPIFGLGMDNYVLYSNVSKATHNAYTQVAAELGIPAAVFYILFLITPLKRLQPLVRPILVTKRRSPATFLAIGLQASLIGYMVTSFFASVAYLWYAYYLVAYAICLRRLPTGEIIKSKSQG